MQRRIIRFAKAGLKPSLRKLPFKKKKKKKLMQSHGINILDISLWINYNIFLYIYLKNFPKLSLIYQLINVSYVLKPNIIDRLFQNVMHAQENSLTWFTLMYGNHINILLTMVIKSSIIIVDDFIRHTWICLMPQKGYAFSLIKAFVALVWT